MKLLKNIFVALLSLTTAFTFQSCSDWNEVTPETPNYELNKDKDPEGYKDYLKNLNEYRELNHKYIYTWFDNSEKATTARYQHIDNVPDSVDVVILTHPDNLVERELKEIAAVREKGTKVVYSIDFDGIKKNYTALLEEEALKEDPQEIDRVDYITKTLQSAFKLADKFNYDGVVLGYVGKSSLHMEEDVKNEYMLDEQLFVNFAKAWVNGHADKLVVFSGAPQNLLDRTILASCKHIIVDVSTARNESALLYQVALAGGEDIPSDRYIVAAQLPSFDPEKPEVGYWSSGEPSLVATANWATGNFSYTVAGIAIIDIKNDYYTSDKKKRIYDYSRKAINILNPSLK